MASKPPAAYPSVGLSNSYPYYITFQSDLMYQNMTRAKKVVCIENQFFSCLSTTQRNFSSILILTTLTPAKSLHNLFFWTSNGSQYHGMALFVHQHK